MCRFFGTSTHIIRILAGAFEDEDHLDTVLGVVADCARGLVPEDESVALLQRVRAAALLAKERQFWPIHDPR